MFICRKLYFILIKIFLCCCLYVEGIVFKVLYVVYKKLFIYYKILKLLVFLIFNSDIIEFCINRINDSIYVKELNGFIVVLKKFIYKLIIYFLKFLRECRLWCYS